jgi:hypothetical protein
MKAYLALPNIKGFSAAQFEYSPAEPSSHSQVLVLETLE